MEYKCFKDYLTERQLREADEAIKVDPATVQAQRRSGEAMARTLMHTSVDLANVKNDPAQRNRLLGTAMQKASRMPGGRAVSAKSLVDKIDPSMKV